MTDGASPTGPTRDPGIDGDGSGEMEPHPSTETEHDRDLQGDKNTRSPFQERPSHAHNVVDPSTDTSGEWEPRILIPGYGTLY